MKQFLSLTAFVFPSAVVLWCGSCSHHCFHPLVRYWPKLHLIRPNIWALVAF